MVALDVAPRGVFENRKFLRPMTNGLMPTGIDMTNMLYDLVYGRNNFKLFSFLSAHLVHFAAT